ncbi:MAG: Methyltransferase [Actinomycetia bacterium]|jgi:hypothetical protein|nr:Methyltransferase [Actinomycetes bacterium]
MLMGNPLPTQERPHGSNSEFPWDDFDSRFYYDHNYRDLRQDDQKIVESVRDFFSELHENGEIDGRLQGLDVGSGANLYPTFTMLPLCRSITMWEYAASNVEWLERQIPRFGPSWDSFWGLLADDPLYGALEDPRQALADRASVTHDSIFNLPTQQWDIGTMFFVAESLTSEVDEFHTATRSFLQALRPGAPFAAAFMENSTGYLVGDRRFPAVAVSTDDIAECLDGYCSDSPLITRIELDDKPLRDGYSGMILAIGKSNGRKAI